MSKVAEVFTTLHKMGFPTYDRFNVAQRVAPKVMTPADVKFWADVHEYVQSRGGKLHLAGMLCRSCGFTIADSQKVVEELRRRDSGEQPKAATDHTATNINLSKHNNHGKHKKNMR